MIVNEETGKLNNKVQDNEGSETLVRTYHQTVKKATEDYTELRFNTAISQLMVFVNEANKQDVLPKELAEGFVKLLAPIAPHISEELWQKLGHDDTITYAEWPTFDESLLVENEVEVVVQINGKVKAKLVVAKDASKDEMEEAARADEKVLAAIEGKSIRKIIAVPGKLVNIVVG